MTAEQKLDMSLLKYAPHYTEIVDPKIEAFRNYKMLIMFQQDGEVDPDFHEVDKDYLEQFASFSPEQQEEHLLQLKSVYSTV